MSLNFNYTAIALCALTSLPACTPKDDGDSDPSTGAATETGDAVTETGADATDTGPDATDTGIVDEDTTTTGVNESETAGDETATDTGATDTGATDTGATDTGETDTGEQWPAECDAVDPEVSATYTIEVEGWVVAPNDSGELDVICSVDAVAEAAGTVTSTLTCDVDGAPAAGVLAIAASPEGPVSWAAGDQVKLIAEIWDEGDFGKGRNVQLRALDDALLLTATEGYIDEGFTARVKPLTLEHTYACFDPNTRSGSGPLRLDFEPVDGPVVGVFHGHRGVMPLAAGEAFAIDVERALGDGSHEDEEMKVLLRRVTTGE